MEFFQSAALVVGAVIVGVIAVALLTIRKLLIIAPPNFAAVITGRQRQLEDGTRIGYRTVSGGRSMRVPLVEQVQWMSLSTIPLEISVADAYSKGNIPLEVKAVANLKIASSPDAVFNNAVERLLGKPLVEIEGLARETLTGNLRGVLSKLTPEEVNEDRLGFARHLSEEADHDLKKLGLQLDVLKIQHVSDRVGYLKAMGEKATSEAIRDAEIAKANAQAETALRQAEATRVAEVATAEASTSIAEAQNLLRVRRAELSREAETAERVAKAEAERAEAEARTRLELQRVDLERTRLQADVVQPAEAARMAAESRAKADAAPILENGRAQAEALRMILAEIHAQGETGIRVFMAEKLPALLASALESMATIDIDRVTVIDSGGGQGVANATTQKVNASLAAVQQVANSMGLDMEGIIQNLARAQITSGADKSKEGK